MSVTDDQTQGSHAALSRAAGLRASRALALLGAALFAAATLLGAAASGSHAANARAQLRGGPLTFAGPPVLSRLARGGLGLTLRVVDARGSGQGWAVELATAGSSGAAATAMTTTVTGARAACAPGSTCTPALTALRYPLAVVGATPRTVFDAVPGSGMGAQVVALALRTPRTPLIETVSLVDGP